MWPFVCVCVSVCPRVSVFPMTPSDDFEQLRWVCVQLDNGAAVHLCLGHIHTHTYTLRHINNSGIWGPTPLGPSQTETLIKALLFQEVAYMVSGSYLNKPRFTDNHHKLPDRTVLINIYIHDSSNVFFALWQFYFKVPILCMWGFLSFNVSYSLLCM